MSLMQRRRALMGVCGSSLCRKLYPGDVIFDSTIPTGDIFDKYTPKAGSALPYGNLLFDDNNCMRINVRVGSSGSAIVRAATQETFDFSSCSAIKFSGSSGVLTNNGYVWIDIGIGNYSSLADGITWVGEYASNRANANKKEWVIDLSAIESPIAKPCIYVHSASNPQDGYLIISKIWVE